MPRHPHDIDLTWEELRDALRQLEGSSVAVRVVERSDPEVLLAAFKGTLGALSTAKRATLFWPVVVGFQRDDDHVEDVGFYLRRDRFRGAVARAGGTVLAIIQGPVLINIRRS